MTESRDEFEIDYRLSLANNLIFHVKYIAEKNIQI